MKHLRTYRRSSITGIHLSVARRSFGENYANQSHDCTNQYNKRDDKDIGLHGETGPSE